MEQDNNNPEAWMAELEEEEEEDPQQQGDNDNDNPQIQNEVIVDEVGANNNAAANNAAANNNANLFELEQVMAIENAMITGYSGLAIDAVHLNTILLRGLGIRSNELLYRGRGKRKSRKANTTERTHVENCTLWIQQFTAPFEIYEKEGQGPNVLYKRLDITEYEGALKRLVNRTHDASVQEKFATKINGLAANNDQVRALRDMLGGLIKESTSLPPPFGPNPTPPPSPDGGGGGHQEWNPDLNDEGTNTNSVKKLMKWIFIVFGLGLIGTAVVSKCVRDKNVSFRCNFTGVPGGNNSNNISSIPSGIISSMINNEQGEGVTIGNSFMSNLGHAYRKLVESVRDWNENSLTSIRESLAEQASGITKYLPSSPSITLDRPRWYDNITSYFIGISNKTDMAPWLMNYISYIKIPQGVSTRIHSWWSSITNSTTLHSVCNHISLDIICSDIITEENERMAREIIDEILEEQARAAADEVTAVTPSTEDDEVVSVALSIHSLPIQGSLSVTDYCIPDISLEFTDTVLSICVSTDVIWPHHQFDSAMATSAEDETVADTREVGIVVAVIIVVLVLSYMSTSLSSRDTKNDDRTSQKGGVEETLLGSESGGNVVDNALSSRDTSNVDRASQNGRRPVLGTESEHGHANVTNGAPPPMSVMPPPSSGNSSSGVMPQPPSSRGSNPYLAYCAVSNSVSLIGGQHNNSAPNSSGSHVGMQQLAAVPSYATFNSAAVMNNNNANTPSGFSNQQPDMQQMPPNSNASYQSSAAPSISTGMQPPNQMPYNADGAITPNRLSNNNARISSTAVAPHVSSSSCRGGAVKDVSSSKRSEEPSQSTAPRQDVLPQPSSIGSASLDDDSEITGSSINDLNTPQKNEVLHSKNEVLHSLFSPTNPEYKSPNRQECLASLFENKRGSPSDVSSSESSTSDVGLGSILTPPPPPPPSSGSSSGGMVQPPCSNRPNRYPASASKSNNSTPLAPSSANNTSRQLAPSSGGQHSYARRGQNNAAAAVLQNSKYKPEPRYATTANNNDAIQGIPQVQQQQQPPSNNNTSISSITDAPHVSSSSSGGGFDKEAADERFNYSSITGDSSYLIGLHLTNPNSTTTSNVSGMKGSGNTLAPHPPPPPPPLPSNHQNGMTNSSSGMNNRMDNGEGTTRGYSSSEDSEYINDSSSGMMDDRMEFPSSSTTKDDTNNHNENNTPPHTEHSIASPGTRSNSSLVTSDQQQSFSHTPGSGSESRSDLLVASVQQSPQGLGSLSFSTIVITSPQTIDDSILPPPYTGNETSTSSEDSRAERLDYLDSMLERITEYQTQDDTNNNNNMLPGSSQIIQQQSSNSASTTGNSSIMYAAVGIDNSGGSLNSSSSTATSSSMSGNDSSSGMTNNNSTETPSSITQDNTDDNNNTPLPQGSTQNTSEAEPLNVTSTLNAESSAETDNGGGNNVVSNGRLDSSSTSVVSDSHPNNTTTAIDTMESGVMGGSSRGQEVNVENRHPNMEVNSEDEEENGGPKKKVNRENLPSYYI